MKTRGNKKFIHRSQVLSLVCTWIISFAIIAGLCWYSNEKSREATLFFEQALAKAHVSDVVEWHGKSYEVHGASVYDADSHVLLSTHTLPLLELAYQKTIARRSPLLAIPGEDMERLRGAISKLEWAQHSFVASAKTPEEKSALANLYPVRFLSALAATEDARRAFVASGSDTDAFAYNAVLQTALSVYQADLMRFRYSFNRAVSNSDITYATADALVNRGALESAFEQLHEALLTIKSRIQRRSQCARGNTHVCDTNDLTYPSADIVLKVEIDSASLATVRQLQSLVASAFNNPEILTSPLVVLPDNVCSADSPGKPIFVLYEKVFAGEAVPAPLFLGDARFIKTDSALSPFLQYFVSHGVSYLWYPPQTHYKCLLVQSDTSTLLATLAVQKLISESPLSIYAKDSELASDLRAIEYRFTHGNSLQEADAIDYLTLAASLGDSLPESEAAGVESLTLQFKYKTGGLGETIRKLALIEHANLTLSLRGIPNDVSVPRLFFSESGFLPLFLGDNGSFIDGTRRLMPRNTLTVSDEPFIYYSTMSHSTESIRRLTYDIAFFGNLYAHP